MRIRDQRPLGDSTLVQIVDAALAENTARSGGRLACKPGCCQCCVGVFEISQLDAVRLREGLTELERASPGRAQAVRNRAEESRRRLKDGLPGNVRTGVLTKDEEAFAEFGNSEPCPVLDPVTGMCDLYEHRPMTCRIFGPPVRSEGGLGVCELCFQGASEVEIAACELMADPDNLESRLTDEYEKKSGHRGRTIVAWGIVDRND